VLIRLALAVIAAVIACNIPHSLIPMFKESLSEATPPPEIQNAIAGKRKIVIVSDSITEAGKYPGGYVWLLQRYLVLFIAIAKSKSLTPGSPVTRRLICKGASRKTRSTKSQI